jgi:putative ABC transport system substrate-binding protein
MSSRELITLVSGAAAWPVAPRAQQSDRMRRVGVVSGGAENDPESKLRLAAFVQGLQKAGWTEGRNLRIDYRWTSADPERTRAYAVELVALAPDVILAGSNQVTTIVSQQTHTIPIVFASASEPLETGLVPNMARPGGNVTGFALFEVAIAGKWLELLKEVAPRLTRVAVFYTLGGASAGFLRVIEAIAPSIGIQSISIPGSDQAEIEHSLDAFAREANGGVIALPGPSTLVHRDQIISLAARHRLPAIYSYKPFVTSGALLSYGTDNADLYRRAASYVDRILTGEKPGDLPVQAPTKYELAINLKTAKALGLDVPPQLLARADEVIE